jgi:2-phosphoglycerate kinase
MVKNPTIILLGGASYIGKSTLSLKLGNKLNISQIVDLDVIRAILRAERTYDEDPYLYFCSTTAWKYKGRETKSNVINSFIRYSKSLEKSVKIIIDRSYELGKPTIIEGVHLIPTMYREYGNRINFYRFMLTAQRDLHFANIAARKEEFGGRSVIRFYERFSKARIINDYLIADAYKNRIPCIINTSLKSAEKEIIQIIKNEID